MWHWAENVAESGTRWRAASFRCYLLLKGFMDDGANGFVSLYVVLIGYAIRFIPFENGKFLKSALRKHHCIQHLWTLEFGD